jgi:pyruvate/2-oxoglutarate/acetoin dehydrogenase E1 component
MNTVQALNLALHDALEMDSRVIVMGEDLADAEGGGVVKITTGLSTKFGTQRVRSTPISEMGFVGAAVGAAVAGLKPVVEIMLMNFTAVCMDQITNHAAKLRFMSGGQTSVPMVIRTMTGAGVSNGGQHSDFLEAWFCHTAGLKVVTASNPADAYGLLLGAIQDPDPVVFIEHLPSYWIAGPSPERFKSIPLGTANVVTKGADVSVFGYGSSIAPILKVQDRLAQQGISIEVVDLRTMSPLDDRTMFASVRKTGRAVIVHEAVRSFGVGAEVSARIHENLFHILKAPVQRVASKDCPVPFAKQLEAAFLFSEQDIEAAIRTTLTWKN